MSYVANVLRVMIASPADIPDARDAVESAIHSWNGSNAKEKQAILQPWRWESSAVPILGAAPQAIINAQGVDESDIVFALFGSRVGSPTTESLSGTVEEIERAVEQGKPVHLYFSRMPYPNNVDIDQLQGLRTFESEIRKRGLLGEFKDVGELEREVYKALNHDMTKLAFAVPRLVNVRNGVRLVVQPKQERVANGNDSRGRQRYITRHWLEITNSGATDATNVTYQAVGERSPVQFMTNNEPTTIHAGQTRRLDIAHALGGEGPAKLGVRWTEDGNERSQEYFID